MRPADRIARPTLSAAELAAVRAGRPVTIRFDAPPRERQRVLERQRVAPRGGGLPRRAPPVSGDRVAFAVLGLMALFELGVLALAVYGASVLWRGR